MEAAGHMKAPVLLSTKEVASQLGTNPTTVLMYARRADDPLPLRYIKGKRNGGFVVVAEFVEWVGRNTCLYKDRPKQGASE